jgi:hypothetical protein
MVGVKKDQDTIMIIGFGFYYIYHLRGNRRSLNPSCIGKRYLSE